MSECKFKPAQPVLVRDDDKARWTLDFFSYYSKGAQFPYVCLMHSWEQCIPLEGNERFLNTTDSPKPKWMPRPLDLVAMQDHAGDWHPVVFMGYDEEEGRYCYRCSAKSPVDLWCDRIEPLHDHFNVPEE